MATVIYTFPEVDAGHDINVSAEWTLNSANFSGATFAYASNYCLWQYIICKILNNHNRFCLRVSFSDLTLLGG